jgi:hypothetical protein
MLRDKGDETADAQLVGAIMNQLQRTGQVTAQEGGGWRLNPNYKSA